MCEAKFIFCHTLSRLYHMVFECILVLCTRMRESKAGLALSFALDSIRLAR